MDRSVLLLLMSALLLSSAVGLPLSLEESDEKSYLDLVMEKVRESEELPDFSHENSIRKRAAKDSSSSSEEHKDKVNSSGASSSEEHKTTTDHAEESTTQAAARRRRQTITKAIGVCLNLLTYLRLRNMQKSDVVKELRLVDSPRQEEVAKVSGELELDAQAEKEMDEQMARAMADYKENGSIEDYAQGCEVMEVSSKEANEATYAE
ncbi:hypothetical protein KR032_009217 [Drosophila birchii]|nr:hypothetical protein KR032_009217 [Drosophila birchii]